MNINKVLLSIIGLNMCAMKKGDTEEQNLTSANNTTTSHLLATAPIEHVSAFAITPEHIAIAKQAKAILFKHSNALAEAMSLSGPFQIIYCAVIVKNFYRNSSALISDSNENFIAAFYDKYDIRSIYNTVIRDSKDIDPYIDSGLVQALLEARDPKRVHDAIMAISIEPINTEMKSWIRQFRAELIFNGDSGGYGAACCTGQIPEPNIFLHTKPIVYGV